MMRKQKYANGGQIAGQALMAGLSGAATGSAVPGIGTLVGAGIGVASSLLSNVGQKSTESTPGMNQKLPISNPSTAHMFAMGGNIQDMASEIEAGGTHEQNPNGGVPVTDQALLEEGEFKVGNFVFSKRLINPETGNSFADDAKRSVDKKRPNDVISNNYSKKKLEQLFATQEAMKPKEEAGPTQQFAWGGQIPDFTNAINSMQTAGVVNPLNMQYNQTPGYVVPSIGIPGSQASPQNVQIPQITNPLDLQYNQTPGYTQPSAGLPNYANTINPNVDLMDARDPYDVSNLDFVEASVPNTSTVSGLNLNLNANLPSVSAAMPVRQPLDLNSGLGSNFDADLAQAQKDLYNPQLNKNPISSLTYAPIASGVGSLAYALASKSKQLGLDTFRNNKTISYSPVDFSQVQRNLAGQIGAQRRAATISGSAGQYLSNLQGLNTGAGQAIANAALQADVTNQDRRFRTESANSQIEAQNQAMRYQIENMNQASTAARTNAILNNLNNLGTMAGQVGNTLTRANIANNLTDYSIAGNYKIQEAFAKAKQANPNLTFEEFRATYGI